VVFQDALSVLDVQHPVLVCVSKLEGIWKETAEVLPLRLSEGTERNMKMADFCTEHFSNIRLVHYRCYVHVNRPPLWSSGQISWLQTQRSRVRFPTLPDFLSSSGSGAGSTQPHEDK
jgi:hypothetical protein